VSIEKKSNGRYLARWRDPAGQQRAKTFDRKLDADRFLASLTVDAMQGRYVDPRAGKVTVRELAVRWVAGQPWRQSTRERREEILDTHVLPTFGSVQVRAVRRSDVQAWIGRMSAGEMAPRTVAAAVQTLGAVMRIAATDRLIAESPCAGVKLPRLEAAQAALVPLTSEQVHAIAERIEPRRYRALVLSAAGLGLRQGEACGLTVDRIDFLRGKVRIDRQLISPRGGKCEFAPPKTPSSNRVVPLPASVRDVLAAHLAEFPAGDRGLVFTSSTGAPVRRSLFYGSFKTAVKALRIDASPHDLRHHCASMLIAAGCSIRAVSQFLGHKNATETLNTYAHLWPNDEDRITAAIDAGLTRVATGDHVAV
jgi:integrase